MTVTAPVRPHIRPLRWTDLPAVQALEQAAFPDDAWSAGSWWAELATRPRRSYAVLEGPGGRVLGYAGLDLAGELADVMTLAVDPRERGAGHGRRLLRHLLAAAGSAGARAVLLEVRADNIAARRLYERHGFTVVHSRSGYYRPEGVDALVMRVGVDGG